MGKPVTYDPAVIQKFAERLYGRATSIVVTSTLIGLVVGLLVGGGIAVAMAKQSPGGQPEVGLPIAIGAGIGALFGLFRGLERAFLLKLEAQKALCQVQIETNTRAKN